MKFNFFRKPVARLALVTPTFVPIFVGGAPRSGTTILYATICSSDKTNGFINECTYFSAFMEPLQIGLSVFDVHTKSYFESREALMLNHAEVLETELKKIWKRTGYPEILALKDPMLTPLFPLLGETLRNAKFVVSVRDPRATISSRIEVTQRAHPDRIVTEEQIVEFCNQYVHMYSSIANARTQLGQRLCLVDYSDVVSGDALTKLMDFGLGTLDTERIWADTIADPTPSPDDPWATSLHGKKPSLASVERFRDHLDARSEGLIMEICGPVARELGAV